jgi:hypothetical protein
MAALGKGINQAARIASNTSNQRITQGIGFLDLNTELKIYCGRTILVLLLAIAKLVAWQTWEFKHQHLPPRFMKTFTVPGCWMRSSLTMLSGFRQRLHCRQQNISILFLGGLLCYREALGWRVCCEHPRRPAR